MNTPTSRALYVCADDFGMSPGIDAAIIQLIEKKRLSRVSVMTIYDRWQESAQWLQGVSGSFQKGLHFCLTGERNRPLISVSSKAGYVDRDGYFLSSHKLFLNTLFRRVDCDKVLLELKAQHERFVSVLGPVDHVDGHHHCHQWPVIAETVLNFTQTLPQALTYRQTSGDPRVLLKHFNLRALTLSILGWRYKKLLERRSLSFNDSFASFVKMGPFNKEEWFGYVQNIIFYQKDTLLAIHPATHTQGIQLYDDLLEERVGELGCLLSEKFSELIL